MTICFIVELVIRLFLTTPLTKLIHVKHTIEKQAGVGLEVGKLNAGPLLQCTRYLTVHNAFRKLHMRLVIGNIITICCSFLHLHYLAHKLGSL